MTTLLYNNFVDTELTRYMGPGDTLLQVSAQAAARMPVPTPGEDQAFHLTLFDGQQPPEIVACNENPGTGGLVVERAVEGTHAQAWQGGTRVRLTITAELLKATVAAMLAAQDAAHAAQEAAGQTNGGDGGGGGGNPTDPSSYLLKANNLSDLASVVQALDNLGLGAIPAVNLIPNSGRFAQLVTSQGSVFSVELPENSFYFPQMFGLVNGAAQSFAGQFINDNGDFGGAAGGMAQTVVDLIYDMGRAGVLGRYGTEFNVAQIAAGAGTSNPLTGTFGVLYQAVDAGAYSFVGAGNKTTYACWIRATSGKVGVVPGTGRLFVGTTEVTGSEHILFPANGWVLIRQVFDTATGVSKNLGALYLEKDTGTVQLALPAAWPGEIDPGLYTTPQTATEQRSGEELLALIKDVDGVESGLDADKLQGKGKSFFAPVYTPQFQGNVHLVDGGLNVSGDTGFPINSKMELSAPGNNKIHLGSGIVVHQNGVNTGFAALHTNGTWRQWLFMIDNATGKQILPKLGLGLTGENWISVNRNPYQNYQNWRDFPIMVSATIDANNIGWIKVDGKPISGIDTGGENSTVYPMALVPAGSSYRIETSNVYNCWELR